MNITRWLMAVSLLLASMFPSAAFAFSSTPTGNVTTFGAFTPSPSNVANYTLSTASDGSVLLRGGPRMQVPGGASIPLNVTGSVPRSTAAAAVGRFVAKVGPLGYVLNTGAALYVLGQELGFTLSNSDGAVQVSIPAAGYCPTAPCYNYQILVSGYVAKHTPLAAAQQGLNGVFGGTCRVTSVTVAPHPTSSGDWRWTGTGNRTTSPFAACTYGPDNLGKFSRAVDTVPQLEPSSVQALQDAIASDTSWPTTSVLGSVLREAIIAGENISVAPQTVTGPATSPGPVTQTVDNLNNTTTTSTTTHNHTYAGPSVTTTTTTTNITIDNSTGNVINSTTTTTQPVMPETPTEDGSPTDKALPGQPQLYQPKYPDGLVGVWNDKKSELSSAPLVALLGDLMPDVASTGACPVWTINTDLGVWDYGIFDLSPPCWLWDFARAIIIACALLLSRRLIFGG